LSCDGGVGTEVGVGDGFHGVLDCGDGDTTSGDGPGVVTVGAVTAGVGVLMAAVGLGVCDRSARSVGATLAARVVAAAFGLDTATAWPTASGVGETAGAADGSTVASDEAFGAGASCPGNEPNPRLTLVMDESSDARATKMTSVARVPKPVRVAPALSAMPPT
jgi:hypothetical protein